MTPTRLPATRLMVSLPILIVITACCIAFCAGTVATWSFYARSERAIDANLAVLAHDRRSAVETVLRSVRQDLVNAAINPLVAKALDNIATSVKIMPPDTRASLAATYGASADDARTGGTIRELRDYYGRAYDVVHPWFRTMARDLGYPDVLFIDRDGNVAYSLAKRADFGGRVSDGTLQGSGLAEVFGRAAALPAGATALTDLRPYAPAGAPTAFAATPLYEQIGSRSDLIGVLVFELPRGRIAAIVDAPDGFGAAGEAVLVGDDGLLRSASRFAPNGGILRDRGPIAPADANSRKGGVATFTDAVRGDVIAAATPLVDPDLHWTMLAVESADEVLGPIRQMVARIILICLVATVLLAGVALLVAARIARPVLALVERFDAALSNMQHGLLMVDSSDRLILCNASFQELYDLPDDITRTGTPVATIEAHRRLFLSSPMAPDAHGNDAGRVDLADGRTVEVFRNSLPSGGFVATHQNITTTVDAQRQITYLATHDALTGLLNRASLTDRLQDVLRRMRPGAMAAVLCLDLDHFKAVNDTLGHPAGDALLKDAAARLLGCLSSREAFARLGGDEFVILQSGITSPDQARDLAERLIAAIALPFDLDGNQAVIGLSIGIAVAPQDGTDSDDLIRNADTALDRAKADGRGMCRFFEAAMDAQLQARRQLEFDLRRALAEGQFSLHYQPVYNAMSEVVTGVEALLRWRHPERGMVSPGEFIPLAEEMGLIVPIGEWVVRQACADAATWPETVRVAVNLSPIQLKSPTLVPAILDALESSGLSPRRLELEITETVLIADDEATLATLHHFKSLGLRIAMDDFGTGYSSLSYLRSFPFDKIKIDQSFVRELGQRADAVAIIKAISDLGATLGIATTVEGIETIEQLHLVRKQGCTEVQGYFMCRPVAAEAIGPLLDRQGEQRRLTA